MDCAHRGHGARPREGTVRQVVLGLLVRLLTNSSKTTIANATQI